MASDYSSMTVKELEGRIERILRKQRNQDDLFRAVVFMGQLDLAKFIYHEKKRQPDTRFVQEKSKSSETTAYGQALVQLLLLAKSRGMDFTEVFRYALEHMEGFEEYKARKPMSNVKYLGAEAPSFGAALKGAKTNGAKQEIRGMPAGRGRASGKAYVVSGKSPISKAPKGSVLILEHADSEISHMIRDFSAVVSDQGGRLCHLAIVAREMGIPAVVGTGNATSIIRMGDKVSVDAGSGKVTVLR
jgi:phosphohistidine swiveling domain-containing protein